MFGSSRELILAIGEQELKVMIGNNGALKFENLEHLRELYTEDYLSIRFFQNNDAANILWEWSFDLIRLIADMNHDGAIIKPNTPFQGRVADTRNKKSHRFLYWINDDDDEGEINEGKGSKGDVPGLGVADAKNSQVDGMRDLVDFFPVLVDVKTALERFPAASHEYRLKQSSDGLKFFDAEGLLPISDRKEERIDAILKSASIASKYANSEVTTVTSAGAPLSNDFLNNIAKDRGGIIFVEATKEIKNAALELEIVEKSSQEVMALGKLWLSISNVEDMYRHINLQSVAKRSNENIEEGLEYRILEPKNNQDDRTKNNYFVFVHGYNVSGQAARGWNAEVFKRLHRLGFNGRFIGVTWHGIRVWTIIMQFTMHFKQVLNSNPVFTLP